MTATASRATVEPQQVPPVKRLRHRAEVPMLLVAGTATFVVLVVFAAIGLTGGDEPGWLTTAAVAVVAGPTFLAAVMIRYLYWSKISNGVEVTARQLPELHGVFADLGARLGMTPDGHGMDKLPRLYVLNGNGVMNAYATKCRVRRGYVVIYSDLLDLAYLKGEFDTIKFVLGHELGHIKCGHVSVWRALLRPVARLLQFGQSVSRAQEYTADRVGSFLAPEGALGLVGLYAGKHMSEHVDLDAYFDSVADHRDGFWLKFVNFRADHAVGFRRLTALKRVETEGWDVHGRML